MHDGASYALVWALPFAGLLLTIAAAPVMMRHHWERHYAVIALGWALAFVVPDLAFAGGRRTAEQLVAIMLDEYLPFVVLVGALYIVTGGIRITGAPRGTPTVNTLILAAGTFIASVIGTPGAALLVLRPLLRANRHRNRSAHVFVFFILLVANIGGSLSPLGDPPLLLGFLRGVPFFWPTVHLALPTALLAGGLLVTFYAVDRFMHARYDRGGAAEAEAETLGVEGTANIVLLAAAVGAILLRALWRNADALAVMGTRWSVVAIASNALLVAVAALSLALTRPATRRLNAFGWTPLVEVAILFAAIFVTLVPVTAMLEAGAAGPAAPLYARMFVDGAPDLSLFFRVTGILSGFLDNAPTYLAFFGLAGGDAARLSGPLAPTLVAISAGACYFGGLSYIGNAPNLMVKAIVESHHVRMPSFLGYIGWAALCLLPWLALVEAVFFH
jgi:Na+/H+ antiporter NhaD/arsenite permease-like protein